jgi:hypothetical protein
MRQLNYLDARTKEEAMTKIEDVLRKEADAPAT